MSTEKQAIIDALRAFAAQRPGLEFGNYCTGRGDKIGRQAYFAEMRRITKDLRDCRTLLRAVELSNITGDELASAFRNAYSGRLLLRADYRLEYCTGQYWPTEYRKAVCAVAAAALWEYFREDYSRPSTNYASPGDRLRAHFRGMFGRSIAGRWFN